MLKKLCYISILAMLFACQKPDPVTPDPEPEPIVDPEPNPDPQPEPVPEKEKMVWIDAHANLSKFQTMRGVRDYMDKIEAAGFNKIVVDVKPCQGDVLYDSKVLPKCENIAGDTNAKLSYDYLAYFIEEAHKRDIKVTVSTTFFTMGSASTKMGPAFTDPKWKDAACIQYKPEGLVNIKDDPSKVAVFLNPVLPEVQECLLEMVREILTKYDVDAYALDYCRYCDAESDFSEASHKAFEEYMGATVDNFPYSIFTYNGNGARQAGAYYKQWWAFRAKVISDFIGRVRGVIKEVKPEVKLEYWAASWWQAIYGNGQNWASPDFYDPVWTYDWYTKEYAQAGFADKLDTFLLGSYLSKIEGAYDNESIEYAINRAYRIIDGDCPIFGTITCHDRNFDVKKACQYCLEHTDGLMVFDLVHIHNNKKWDAIKEGIDAAEVNLGIKK